MKKRIEQLMNGTLSDDVPKLILSEEKIIVSTPCGVNYRAELDFHAENHIVIKGAVLSSHRRLLLGKDQFSGNLISIPYGFDVSGMKPEDQCEGVITISSTLGEYEIPFVLTIQEETMDTSKGIVKDLESFVKLAIEDFREAFVLFKSPGFEQLLKDEKEQVRNMYVALSENPVTYQHLEEFLVAIGAKEKITCSLEESSQIFEELPYSLKNPLIIHKNHWGYVRMEISVIGDFLEVEKKVITSDDFIGSMYPLEYIIKRDRLGKGKKYGKIILSSVYQTLEFEVVASLHKQAGANVRLLAKAQDLKLLQVLLDYQLGKIDQGEWLVRSYPILESMKYNGLLSDVHQLFEAYLYLCEGRVEQTHLILDAFLQREFQLGERLLAGLYLYVGNKSDYFEENDIHVQEHLFELYKKQQDNYFLLNMLLDLDQDIKNVPLKRLFMLERQYELGCRSPFLYLDAIQTMEQDLTCLRKLSGFHVQALLFGLKHDVLSEELLQRIGYLVGFEKEYNPSVYQLLTHAYDKIESKELLESICKYIMKGNPGQKRYFRWYEKAVEEELRLTRLYEYYVETMEENLQKELPQKVKYYFLYNNTLSDKKKAFVYANIVMNQQRDPSSYDSYQQHMEQFAYRKLREGRFNEHFGILYQRFIKAFDDSKVVNELGGMVFTYKIYCDNPKIRNVIVYHKEFKEELRFPLVEQVAYITTYTKDACILFEDEKKRRFVTTVAYSIQKIMDHQELLEKGSLGKVKDSGLLVHLTKEVYQLEPIQPEQVVVYQRCLASHYIDDTYKAKIRQMLLIFYRDGKENNALEEFLQTFHIKTLDPLDKPLYIEVLIGNGHVVQAFHDICKYGYERIAITKLISLCNALIGKESEEEREELLYLCWYVFKQAKADIGERVLKYLLQNFEGNLAQYDALYMCVKDFTLEIGEFVEKVLVYAMYVRAYLPHGCEMLETYIAHNGNETIIKAFGNFMAYGYFKEYCTFHPFLLQHFEDLYTQGTLTNELVLALLKMYITDASCWDDKREAIDRLLKYCNERGIRMKFFLQLPESFLLPYQLNDRIMIEYQAKEKSQVCIHYRIESGEHKEAKTVIEPLNQVYKGYFTKEFVLFYGERLCYSFEIYEDGHHTFTKEACITKEESKVSYQSKYDMLNALLRLREKGEHESFDKLMKQYLFYEKLGNLTKFGGQLDE